MRSRYLWRWQQLIWFLDAHRHRHRQPAIAVAGVVVSFWRLNWLWTQPKATMNGIGSSKSNAVKNRTTSFSLLLVRSLEGFFIISLYPVKSISNMSFDRPSFPISRSTHLPLFRIMFGPGELLYHILFTTKITIPQNRRLKARGAQHVFSGSI